MKHSEPARTLIRLSAALLIGLGFFQIVLTAGSPVRPTVKVKVSNPVSAERLLGQGARRIADYGAFQVLEVSESAQREAATRDGVEIREDYDWVMLNAGPLDTRGPAAAALKTVLSPFSGRRLHLVQFDGPVRPAWREALLGTGLEIVASIPANAYLVYGDFGSLHALQRLADTAGFIQWEAPYLDCYKIQPGVSAAPPATEDPRKQSSETGVYAIQLVRDGETNAGTLRALASLAPGGVRLQYDILDYRNIITTLPAAAIAAVSALPDVVSIDRYPTPIPYDEIQDMIISGHLNAALPSGPGYLDWLLGLGFSQEQFSASGFAVDVGDSGIDNGTSSPNHSGLYENGIRPGVSRVLYNRVEGTGSELRGCDGHGTLNAHIVGGFNDETGGFPHASASGYHYGLGVCPWVRLGSSVLFSPDWTHPSFPDLMSRAYRDGARISTNSWGPGFASGSYSTDAQAYDALVRDAQPAGSAVPADGNQEMVVCFSAGNSGPYSTSIGVSGKNIISVGGTENVQSFGGGDQCGVPDSQADNALEIVSFSSRGPCQDGRTLPNLLAPATHVSGGVTQIDAPPPNGQATTCFDASGVCGGPNSSASFWPAGQQWYTASSGTSHSCPAVAGGTALVRQYFLNRGWGGPPSPAMTKAYLLNSARYLPGSGTADTLPSNNQGMGLLDLGMAFDGVPRILHDQRADLFTTTGQSRVSTGTIHDPARPFRVTLAWTDAPGSTTGNAYNNDLDLTVTVNGQTYRGNVFSGAFSATGGAADLRNNVESVFLPAGATGSFAIAITAANLNSDGVPGNALPLDQDFALVVYNGIEVPMPAITAGPASLTGESCGPPNGAPDPGETVTFDLALTNVGSAATVDLTATLLPTGGVTSPGGPQHYGAIALGTTASRPFTFTVTGNCGDPLTVALSLQDGNTGLGYVEWPLRLGFIDIGHPPPMANPGAILIPDKGPANPYPSSLTVSGITGRVNKVTATIAGLSHTWPADIDLLLVGPGGQAVVLMADAGSSYDIADVMLTFDDEAASQVPKPIVSGTYKPSALGTAGPFPAPAPSPPFDSRLSVFHEVDPNGIWTLYVYDDATGNLGYIGAGWSLAITTEMAICCQAGGPATPSGLTAAAFSTSAIDLAWSDNATDEEGYRIERKSAGETEWAVIATLGPDIIAFRDTGLPACTEQRYRVRAWNAGGEGLSNEAVAATPGCLPATPSGLIASVAESLRVDLAWSANSIDEDGFEIERKKEGEGTWIPIATTGPGITAYTDTALVPNSRYGYRVRAFNAWGRSDYSNEAFADTFPQPPAAPSHLTVTPVSPTQFNLSWLDHSGDESGFQVERRTGSSGDFLPAATLDPDTTAWPDTRLEPGSTYFYRVYAFNFAGHSAYSNVASATAPAEPPAAPSGLTATAVSARQISLKWLDNSANESGFQIERRAGVAESWALLAIVGPTEIHYQDHSALPDRTYSYRVYAFNTGGYSPPSNKATTTTSSQPPAAPSSLVAYAVTSSRIDLAWADHAGNEAGFTIDRRILNQGGWGPLAAVAAGVTVFSDTRPAEGAVCFYRVRAWNDAGTSAWSNQAGATTAEYDYYIPAAAHTAGLYGTFWQTDLDLLNPRTDPATVEVALLRANTDNSNPVSITRIVPPRSTARLVDVLGTAFTVSNAALGVRVLSGWVEVNSRFYNTASPCGGTYGMYIDGVEDTEASWGDAGATLAWFHLVGYSPDPAAGFRTNVGFVNASAVSVQVLIRLFGDNGEFLGWLSHVLLPYEHRQFTRIHEFLRSPVVNHGTITVEVLTEGGKVHAYAMLIDNLSGDPIYLPAENLPR